MRDMEVGDRVASAMYEENSGNPYHRINVIRGRALDALIFRVLGPEGGFELHEDN